MREKQAQELMALAHGESVSQEHLAPLSNTEIQAHVKTIRAEDALFHRALGRGDTLLDQARRQELRRAAAHRTTTRVTVLPNTSTVQQRSWLRRTPVRLAMGVLALAALIALVWAGLHADFWRAPHPAEQAAVNPPSSSQNPPVKPGESHPNKRAEKPEKPASITPTTPSFWARVEAGNFHMGPRSLKDPKAILPTGVNVTITRPLFVMRKEVTVKDWTQVMGGALRETMKQNFGRVQDNYPITCVNWYNAVSYANQKSIQDGFETCYELSQCTGKPGAPDYRCAETSASRPCNGYRLPSEAEWEYFARAQGRPSSWGWDHNRARALTREERKRAMPESPYTKGPHAVGTSPPNGWGIYDTLGNAQEWTLDVFETSLLGGKDPVETGPSRFRVLRGDAFDAPELVSPRKTKAFVPVEHRWKDAPHRGKPTYGFRLVRTEVKGAKSLRTKEDLEKMFEEAEKE